MLLFANPFMTIAAVLFTFLYAYFEYITGAYSFPSLSYLLYAVILPFIICAFFFQVLGVQIGLIFLGILFLLVKYQSFLNWFKNLFNPFSGIRFNSKEA